MSTFIITGSTTLRELNVGCNDIGDSGISMIAQWLLSNKTLTKLNVSSCNLSVKGSYCTIQDVLIMIFNGWLIIGVA